MANTTTLGDIAEIVSRKILNRDDAANDFALTATLQAYRSMCSKVPFEELHAESAELTTTASTARYDLGSLITDDIAGIIAIRYSPSSGSTKFRLRRSQFRRFLSQGAAVAGTPRTYARSVGTAIDLNPMPASGSDTFLVYYWKQPTIADNVSKTTLEFPDEWEVLLQFETLFLTYHFLQEPEKALMLMQPNPMPMPYSSKKRISTEVGVIPRLWNDLMETRSNRELVDEEFSINPVSRAYTWGAG